MNSNKFEVFIMKIPLTFNLIFIHLVELISSLIFLNFMVWEIILMDYLKLNHSISEMKSA